MSYDARDAAMDEMYDRMSDELYPDHKARAIEEVTTKRFHAYYKQHSFVMRPAVDMVQEGNKLKDEGHFAAAVVFYMTAVEILLKATVLRPVILGLIHNEELAAIVVDHTLTGTGFDRYTKLLAGLFDELVGIKLDSIKAESGKTILAECTDLQNLRNGVIHRGESRTEEEANRAHTTANAVFHLLVDPMICALGLTIIERGEIRESESVYRR